MAVRPLTNCIPSPVQKKKKKMIPNDERVETK